MSALSTTDSLPGFSTPSPRSSSRTRRSSTSSGSGEGDTGRQEEKEQDETPGASTNDDATPLRPPPDVTENLPSYLLRLTSRDEAINLEDVTEEAKEKGDGGDSDDEADDFLDHDAAMVEATAERHEEGTEDEDVVDDGDRNSVVLQKGPGPAVQIDIQVPGTPDDWVPAQRKVDKGQPNFVDVDNPGDWSEYTFRPEFEKTGGRYKHHVLPTGATPLPPSLVNNKRELEGWEFHYKGWTGTNNVRDGASREDLFPECRKGCLDKAVLERMGMTPERMQQHDALFFYQLLLPICDPKRSDIVDDPRKPFYCQVEQFSNLYGYSIGLGGSYGHKFRVIELHELVRFDGVVVKDGVRGGSDGALYRRWIDGSDYDHDVADSINHSRWLQIKRTYKLCNNDISPKRGEPGYNPAYKYDMLYDTLIHNINQMTEFAESDQCGDETTWPHGGYGEAGSGLLGRIMGKPGVTKGGQIVVISDVHRMRPRAYIHRHKLHTKPTGWTASGPLEVKMMMEKILPMVQGEDNPDKLKQIFRVRPHTTWDNYFSGCKILDWLGERGFGATMTCRRDRLPSAVPSHYLHKKKTGTDKRSKAARFHEPVVLAKQVEEDGEKKAFERVHTSFQSTSSCNISMVNAINNCSMFIRRKERGTGENKRYWGIEMNDARTMYLRSYFRIDCMDHMIKNARLFYRSWKYWHSPMLHGKALAVVVAYDMYLEVAEGKIMPEWKLEEPLDFWRFREQLAKQMLAYKPSNRSYPGDSRMRASTQQSRRQREVTTKRGPGRPRSEQGPTETENDQVTKKDLQVASRGPKARLCGELSLLKKHIEGVSTGRKHPKRCVVCGEQAYSVCTLCNNKAMHFFPKKGVNAGTSCFIDYHNDSFFGLAYEDVKLLNKRKGEWSPANLTKQRNNKKYIKDLKGDGDDSD
jgi:hypothetical protein